MFHLFPVPHLEVVHPHSALQAHHQQTTQAQAKSNKATTIKETVEATTKSAAFMKLAHRANGNVLRIKGVLGPELGTKTM